MIDALKKNRPNANKRSVLFVAPSFGKLSEVWMYRQATQLLGARVHFICRSRENEAEYPDKGCVVSKMPTFGTGKKGVFGRFKAIGRRLGNFRYGCYPSSRQEVDWWKTHLDKFNPEITLFHYGTEAVKYGALFTALKRDYAIHFNGYDLSSRLKDARYRKKLVVVARNAKALVVVANYMREWLIKHGVHEDRVHYVPYGIPMSDFPQVQPQDGSCRFLMVGRLTAKKAPELSIKAFANCLESNPGVSLRIIGNGELDQECKTLVQKMGLENAVTFLGAQPSDIVRKEMSAASVFLQHSLTPESGDKEGWPVAVAEAAASGLPVISTRHASIPEQVLHGQTGLLSNEGDWRAMAEHMNTLGSNQLLRFEYGKNAHKHISQWNVAFQVSKLSEVLLQCKS